MGRPLKIKKIIETGYNSTTGANPGVDIGFAPFSALTAPVVPDGFTPNSATEYEGVVGGSNTVDSANYPTVKCRIFVTGLAEEDGYIIRQKGSHKYLVGGITARTALVANVSYRITVVGDTNWAAYGVTGSAAVGTIFTATAALANTGTGRVNAVGVCILANEADAALTSGNMNITFSLNDSTAQTISKLTNKFMLDWTGGSNYEATSVVGDKRYATNFFTDEGTVIKSGTTGAANTGSVSGGQQNLLDLGIVEKYNS
jgi:hypothetical protein